MRHLNIYIIVELCVGYGQSIFSGHVQFCEVLKERGNSICIPYNILSVPVVLWFRDELAVAFPLNRSRFKPHFIQLLLLH
jgi:hypothetical protein